MLTGFGCIFDCRANNRKVVTASGTPGYKAPEVSGATRSDSKKIDIFSLGVCMFMLSFCERPFGLDYENNPFDAINRDGCQNASYIQFLNMDGQFSEDSFEDLFIQTIRLNPASRPTVEQLIRHQWFKGAATLEEASAELKRRNLLVGN